MKTYLYLIQVVLWRTITIGLLSCFIFPYSTIAQSNTPFNFEEVSLEVNGQKFNTFFSIVQDHEGYLWYGTGNGLVRYDGYESKVYRNDPNDPSSIGGHRLLDLGENPILLLFVDSQGVLWAGTTNDLSRYDPNCDCFSHYHLPVDKGQINAITEDKNNNLWVGGHGGGIFMYERENDRFVSFLNKSEDPNFLKNDYVNALISDQDNNIWIGLWNKDTSTGGLIRFNPRTGATRRFLNEPNNSNSLKDNRISSLFEDHKGQIWVGTVQNGLHVYTPQTGEILQFSPDSTDTNQFQAPYSRENRDVRSWAVNILYQNQNGNFWIGSVDLGPGSSDPIKKQTVDGTLYHLTGIGLNHFSPAKGTLTNYNLSDIGKVSTTLFEDRQGQVWLGYQRNGGLFKMDNYARKFKKYPELKGVQRSSESQTYPGVFWISTLNEGLFRLDSKSETITNFLHDRENKNSIGHNSVRATYEDQDGILWIGLGTGGNVGGEDGKGGFDRFDTQTGIFKHYKVPRDDTSNFSLTIYTIAKGVGDFLWMETGTETLLRFDKNKEVLKKYHFPSTKEGSKVWLFGENTVNFFGAVDYTNNVAYQYDIEQDTFISFLEGYQVNALAKDDKGAYWIATMQGLVYYNPKQGNREVFTTKEGLVNDQVVGIIAGEAGIYWLSTRVGLTKFNSKTKEFTSEGLPQDHFHINNIKARDGQFLFGGNDLLYAFYPDQINGNPFPPTTIIKSFGVNGQLYSLGAKKQDKMKLSYDQNDLSFEYVGIHNSSPTKNKYQYKLHPYDKNWIDAGYLRTARYASLDPGSYIFQVKSANSDGVWNQEEVSLSFVIALPWWQTGWAYLSYIVVIGFVAYWLYWFLLNRQLELQETKRLKELDHVKTKLYTNISHEFRTPLTVISGMAQKIKDNPRKWAFEGSNMINRNSNYLLQLVNQILELRKLESGALKIQNIQSDITSYLQYIMQSFQSMAENKDIRLHFYAEEKEIIMDFDQGKIQHIVSNLLSNAIKYTPEGGDVYVTISINEGRKLQSNDQPETLVLKVRDSGIGIPDDQIPHIFDRFYQIDDSSTRKGEGTGIGLALTKELIQLLRGDISVKSEVNKGTEFTVLLPIFNRALKQEVNWDQEVKIPTRKIQDSNDLISDAIIISDSKPIALIIEDNADVAQYLFSCLEDQYQIIWAKNGHHGIQKAYESIPDIIISDVMMPEKDGFEVCQTLKQEVRTSHIPIILLTAKADVDSKLEGLSYGADDYLAKPFNPKELNIRIENLIEMRKQLQKQYQNYSLENKQPKNLEDIFLNDLNNVIQENLNDETFGIQQLCKAMGMSRTQLHRKIKTLTNKSTSIYIRSIKLTKAKMLLKSTTLNISQIAYEVGFSNPVYFTQVFVEEFGLPPSEMRE